VIDMGITLQQGLTGLRLDLSLEAQKKLLDYLVLVRKWNKVYNLTAVRDEGKMLTHHLLDSLAVVPHVRHAVTLLDVGSGAGLPGIPLAIALPGLQVTLLDSNQKKTTFLRQAKMQLALANVTVVCERVEKYEQKQELSVVTSRAFAELHEFASLAGHLLTPGGQLIAMKGADPAAEISRLKGPYRSAGVTRIHVPGLDAERHLVFLKAA
jgi:16S rRNA (guanine527-N7)-methyltransferase